MIEPAALFRAPREAPWIAPDWEGIARRELRLPRCSACGAWRWYPLAAGPGCAGAHYVWETVSGRAELFTWTRVERPLLPGISQPYLTGLVRPLEAPTVRIAARLDCAGEPVIGSPTRIAFAEAEDGPVPYFIVENGK